MGDISMFALCDCNNFYSSVERLFCPSLQQQPVVVLSNNDGCVIARSEEAKQCGIRMGDPEFLIRDIIKTKKIHVFSSNYKLYGDISQRVMHNLSRWFPQLDVYSIDEAFGWLGGVQNLDDYVPKIRSSVVRNTGIPISIGVAPTKTLAKVANKLAKKNAGVCILDDADKITDALNSFPVEDLWGIGKQHYHKLEKLSIKTALQLRAMPEMWLKEHMTVMGQRLWTELWGKPAYGIEGPPRDKKAVSVSRSFQNYITHPDILSEAVTTYATRLAEKLRKKQLKCYYLQVFLYTNKHRDDHPQHFPTLTHKLPIASSNTHELVQVSTKIARVLFQNGINYRKAGVVASGLIPEGELQYHLFKDDQQKLDKLSAILDKINSVYGRGTLKIASEGYQKKWQLKHEYLSKGYTTRWHDIVKVR